jgi:hypothetical protein
MREIRLYGSEGGEVMSLPDPYHFALISTAKHQDGFPLSRE